jgi:type III pantothenate kinase
MSFLRVVIDIGNTSATVGVVDDAGPPPSFAPVFRIATAAGAAEVENALRAGLAGASAHRDGAAIVIGSVVPGAVAPFEQAVRHVLETKAQVLGKTVPVPVKNLTRKPEQTGLDRLVNGLAACKRFGGPCIVADYGTALTIDLFGPDGSFHGGCILPGISTGAKSLAAAAPRLPVSRPTEPVSARGQTTEAAIAAGLFHGHVGAAREILARLTAESAKKFRSARAPVTVVTGGDAEPIASHPGLFEHHVPELTLEGIAIAMGW